MADGRDKKVNETEPKPVPRTNATNGCTGFDRRTEVPHSEISGRKRFGIPPNTNSTPCCCRCEFDSRKDNDSTSHEQPPSMWISDDDCFDSTKRCSSATSNFDRRSISSRNNGPFESSSIETLRRCEKSAIDREKCTVRPNGHGFQSEPLLHVERNVFPDAASVIDKARTSCPNFCNSSLLEVGRSTAENVLDDRPPTSANYRHRPSAESLIGRGRIFARNQTPSTTERPDGTYKLCHGRATPLPFARRDEPFLPKRSVRLVKVFGIRKHLSTQAVATNRQESSADVSRCSLRNVQSSPGDLGITPGEIRVCLSPTCYQRASAWCRRRRDEICRRRRPADAVKSFAKPGRRFANAKPRRRFANERKASKVLGILFAVFVCLWSPFFVVNVLGAVDVLNVQDSPQVMAMLVWLGYSSSFANPVIYTVFSRTFRSAFYNIVACKYRKQTVRIVWKSVR